MTENIRSSLLAAFLILLLFTLSACGGGLSPLYSAASKGDIREVERLLDEGADVNPKSNHDTSALVYAAGLGHLDIVKLLIERGADVNWRLASGWSALIYAAYNGHHNIAKHLIENGADVNAKSTDGDTALMFSAKHGHTEIVKLLIEKNAYVKAKNHEGMTALDLASTGDTMNLLREVEKRSLLKDKTVATESGVVSSSGPPGSPRPKLTSDVDIDIPVTGVKNRDAVAVVIGNRDYTNKDVPAVDFAVNDAKAVKKYLIKVLGYDEANIIYRENATKGAFEAIFGNKESFDGLLHSYLKKGRSDIFVYYSGHGAPDVKSKQGYFVPVDADPMVIKFTGYQLKLLYENLAKIAKDKKSPNVFVAIDSCFSGSTEKGFLLKNVSPITVEVSNPLLAIPNSVVMTSASGAEVSSWYPEKGHSMFTYFFLKGLKEKANKGGTATAADIFSVISDDNDGVPYYAKRLNGRFQTPQITGDKNRIIIKR